MGAQAFGCPVGSYAGFFENMYTYEKYVYIYIHIDTRIDMDFLRRFYR